MKNKKFKDKYLVYSRKSTDDAQNQKNSIDYQVGQGQRFSEFNSLPIADVSIKGFCDNGIICERHSAYKTSGIKIKADGSIAFEVERPKFQKLVSVLAKNEFKGVICLCWDRISRNDKDAMVIKQLISQGVEFNFVQANYDKSSSGALHMDIDGMFSEHYSRNISEKVRDTFTKLRSEGKCTYVSPIGYLDEPNNKKVFDKKRSKCVKRLFELYVTGEWSINQLAKWAIQQGLTQKPRRRQRTKEEMLAGEEIILEQKERLVTRSTIEGVLKNPFYIGKIIHEDQIMQGRHPALIDVSLFNKVQDVLAFKRVSVRYIDKIFFTYRGLIRCACGRLYSPYTKKGINYYTSKCLSGCKNKNKNIKEDDLHKFVEKIFDQIYFSDEEIDEIETRLETKIDNNSENRNSELDDLHIQRKRVHEDMDYLKKNKISLLRHNTMSPKEYRDDYSRLEVELEDIGDKLKVLELKEKEMVEYILTFSELVKMGAEYYKYALDTERLNIISKVFSELIICDKKLKDFEAKDGFQALFSRHKQTKKHQQADDFLFGSEGGIRTHDQLVNSQLLYH
jgi:site-specific DNA recombinase